MSATELGQNTRDYPSSLTWTASFANMIDKVWPENVQEVRILTRF